MTQAIRGDLHNENVTLGLIVKPILLLSLGNVIECVNFGNFLFYFELKVTSSLCIPPLVFKGEKYSNRNRYTIIIDVYVEGMWRG